MLLCLEFANNILIFAVLERWLLQLRETDSSCVFIIPLHRHTCHHHVKSLQLSLSVISNYQYSRLCWRTCTGNFQNTVLLDTRWPSYYQIKTNKTAAENPHSITASAAMYLNTLTTVFRNQKFLNTLAALCAIICRR